MGPKNKPPNPQFFFQLAPLPLHDRQDNPGSAHYHRSNSAQPREHATGTAPHRYRQHAHDRVRARAARAERDMRAGAVEVSNYEGKSLSS